jgi:hypothetical protein
MQQQSVFDPIPYAAGEAFTIGGFVSQTIPAGDTGVFANNGGGANSVGAFASVSNNQFKLNFVGVIYIGPTGQAFFPVNYHSYFYAVSWVKSVDYCNIVSIDLVTGQIVTEVMGTGGFNTLGGTGGASCFGPGSQNGMDGFYGPHMWSSTFMSMKELVAWACDPWAFWYPNA